MAKRGFDTELSVLDDARGETEEFKRHKGETDESVVTKLEALLIVLSEKVENLEKALTEVREENRSSIREVKEELARERSAREEKETEVAELTARLLPQAEKALAPGREETRKIWEAIPEAIRHQPTEDDMQIVNIQPETAEIMLNEPWRLTNFGFMRLSCLRSIRSVAIVGNVEKPALVHVYSMTWLEELKLHLVNEPMFPEVKNLISLRHLELHETPLSGNSLANLTALTSLKILVLSQQIGVSFTSDTMVYVGKLENLEHLDIANTQVCDYGLWCLSSLVKLRWLSLPRNISYRGMEYLKCFKSLTTLVLRFVTSQYSLECLKAFSCLKNVGVRDYEVLEMVHRSLPSLNAFVIDT